MKKEVDGQVEVMFLRLGVSHDTEDARRARLPATSATNCSARSSGSGASMAPIEACCRSSSVTSCSRGQLSSPILPATSGNRGAACHMPSRLSSAGPSLGPKRGATPPVRLLATGLEVVERRRRWFGHGQSSRPTAQVSTCWNERVLAREPGVDRRLGGLCRRSDRFHRRALVAIGQKQAQGLLSHVTAETGRFLGRGSPRLRAVREEVVGMSREVVGM